MPPSLRLVTLIVAIAVWAWPGAGQARPQGAAPVPTPAASAPDVPAPTPSAPLPAAEAPKHPTTRPIQGPSDDAPWAVHKIALDDGRVLVWLEPAFGEPSGREVLVFEEGRHVPGHWTELLALVDLIGRPQTPPGSPAASGAPTLLGNTGPNRWQSALAHVDHVTHAVSTRMQAVGQQMDRAAGELGHVLDRIELAVGDELEQAAQELRQAGHELSQAAEELGQVADELGDACGEIGDAFGELGDAAGDAFDELAAWWQD